MALPPGETLALVGEADNVKPWAVPLSEIACGTGEALSMISTNPGTALLLPASGEKVMLNVQFDPTARVPGFAGHVLVSANEP